MSATSLFSSLALSSGVASSVIMGVQPPAAPDIPEQSIVKEVQDDSGSPSSSSSSSSRSSSRTSSNGATSSSVEDEIASASRILTGDDDTLEKLSQPHGIDISSHQHGSLDIDLKNVIDGGQNFVFVKATEGTHYVNPYFRSDVIKAMDKGIPVGFYHYARPSDSTKDAREQAQAFIAKTGIDKGVKSLPPVLDIEQSDDVENSSDLIAWTQAFVDEVKDETGQDVMIYTYPSFWKNEMGNTTQFSHLPLWIAHYNGSTQPETPLVGGWEDWTFWQYSDKGIVDGHSAKLDANLFNGTQKELIKLYESSQGEGNSSSSESTTPTVTKTVEVQS